MKRSISRVALAVALTAGAFGATASLSPAHAQLEISKAFREPAVALQTKVTEAKENPAVVAAADKAKTAKNELFAAREDAAKAAAQAKLDAARAEIDSAGGGLKAALSTAVAAIEKPDDRMFTGQMALSIGQLMADASLQKRGIDMMIESGFLPAEEMARYHYYSGALGYEAGDLAAARTSLQKAIDLGHTGDNVGITLSEAYFRDKMYGEGLAKLEAALAARKAAGLDVTDDMYFRGLGVAANNQLDDEAYKWAVLVLENEPNEDYRQQAYRVVRAVGPFTPDEELDLLRLMQRSQSFSDRIDVIAYLQAADARRRPGEVRALIDSAVADGLISLSDSSIAEAKNTADSRYDTVRGEIAVDAKKAAGESNGVEALALADIYLGYGDAAKAEELYSLAMTKGGVNMDQVRTGLAIAQADQGKMAEAMATFQAIETANRAQLARLWMAFLNNSQGG